MNGSHLGFFNVNISAAKNLKGVGRNYNSYNSCGGDGGVRIKAMISTTTIMEKGRKQPKLW